MKTLLLAICFAVTTSVDAQSGSPKRPNWTIDRVWNYADKLEEENRIHRQEMGRLHSENAALKSQNDQLKAQLERLNPAGWKIAPAQAASAATDSGKESVARWREVARFSGNGRQNTAPFTISGSEWRVRWSFSGTGEAAPVFSVSTKGAAELLLANTMMPGSEVTYGRGKGRFNFEVTGMFARWQIVVEELR